MDSPAIPVKYNRSNLADGFRINFGFEQTTKPKMGCPKKASLKGRVFKRTNLQEEESLNRRIFKRRTLKSTESLKARLFRSVACDGSGMTGRTLKENNFIREPTKEYASVRDSPES